MPGNVLEVAVPLRRCALSRVARHGVRAWRDNHDRHGMALGHAGVDAILVIRTVGGERRHRPCDLVEQGIGLRCVVHVLGGQRGGHDPASAGVHAQVQHAPRPACRRPPCFSSSHSPLPHSFRPVLSSSRCMGSPPALAPAFPGRGTSSVAARRLKVVWSGTRKLRPSRPMTEPISPSACR